MPVSLAELLIALPAAPAPVADGNTPTDGTAQIEGGDFHRELGRVFHVSRATDDREAQVLKQPILALPVSTLPTNEATQPLQATTQPEGEPQLLPLHSSSLTPQFPLTIAPASTSPPSIIDPDSLQSVEPRRLELPLTTFAPVVVRQYELSETASGSDGNNAAASKELLIARVHFDASFEFSPTAVARPRPVGHSGLGLRVLNFSPSTIIDTTVRTSLDRTELPSRGPHHISLHKLDVAVDRQPGLFQSVPSAVVATQGTEQIVLERSEHPEQTADSHGVQIILPFGAQVSRPTVEDEQSLRSTGSKLKEGADPEVPTPPEPQFALAGQQERPATAASDEAESATASEAPVPFKHEIAVADQIRVAGPDIPRTDLSSPVRVAEHSPQDSLPVVSGFEAAASVPAAADDVRAVPVDDFAPVTISLPDGTAVAVESDFLGRVVPERPLTAAYQPSVIRPTNVRSEESPPVAAELRQDSTSISPNASRQPGPLNPVPENVTVTAPARVETPGTPAAEDRSPSLADIVPAFNSTGRLPAAPVVPPAVPSVPVAVAGGETDAAAQTAPEVEAEQALRLAATPVRTSSEMPATSDKLQENAAISAASVVRDHRRAGADVSTPEFPISNDGTTAVSPGVSQSSEAVSRDVPVLHSFTGQVASAVSQSLRNEPLPTDTIRELTIRLDPPELGALRIRMRTTDDGMQVDVEAADEVTLEMLTRRVPEIEEVLRLQKSGVQSFNVHRMPSGSGESSMSHDSSGNSSQAGLFDERNGERDPGSQRQRPHLNQENNGERSVRPLRSREEGIRA